MTNTKHKPKGVYTVFCLYGVLYCVWCAFNISKELQLNVNWLDWAAVATPIDIM